MGSHVAVMVGGSGRRQWDRMSLLWLEGVGGDSGIACRCYGWREWEETEGSHVAVMVGGSGKTQRDRMLLPWLEGVGGDSVIAC